MRGSPPSEGSSAPPGVLHEWIVPGPESPHYGRRFLEPNAERWVVTAFVKVPRPAPKSSRRSAPMQKLHRLAQEDGQTMSEYATVLTVITLACLAAFGLLAAASTGAIGRVAGLFP